MKKKYETPIVEVIRFDKEDIITTSSYGEVEWWDEDVEWLEE